MTEVHQRSPTPVTERPNKVPPSPPSRDDQDDKPARTGEALLSAAADSAKEGSKEKLSSEEQVDALEWFLSDSDATDLTHSFEINVGSPSQKRWATWTVQPVDMDRLRKIRRSSQQSTRRGRITGNQEMDENAANIQIVIEGTVHPDMRAAAEEIGVVDPSVALRTRFAHKPGLLAQIAGEIMSLSGYDDEDVREVDAARG